MKKEELKTLKDLGTNQVVNEVLKKEAIKRVKNCCPDDNVGGIPLRKAKRCVACERDIWFNNLTEEDLK